MVTISAWYATNLRASDQRIDVYSLFLEARVLKLRHHNLRVHFYRVATSKDVTGLQPIQKRRPKDSVTEEPNAFSKYDMLESAPEPLTLIL